MNYEATIAQLDRNKAAFVSLMFNLPPAEYNWRPAPDKWNLLELVCHLRDEEIYDFRERTRVCLLTPGTKPPSFDPAAMVTERNYAGDNYVKAMASFLDERTKSVEWLRSLDEPNWDNGFEHSHFGKMTAGNFLTNWLAHDYLHMQQALRMRLQYLKEQSGDSLEYAGG